jgi:hypothetical protein
VHLHGYTNGWAVWFTIFLDAVSFIGQTLVETKSKEGYLLYGWMQLEKLFSNVS